VTFTLLTNGSGERAVVVS